MGGGQRVFSSPSLVCVMNIDHSCLSVLDIVGSCSVSVSSELICLELASILLINFLLIRMAANSRESPTSFSAVQALICSQLGLGPGKGSLTFTWKVFRTTCLAFRLSSLVQLFFSNCLVVWVFSRARHLPWIAFPASGAGWL